MSKKYVTNAYGDKFECQDHAKEQFHISSEERVEVFDGLMNGSCLNCYNRTERQGSFHRQFCKASVA